MHNTTNYQDFSNTEILFLKKLIEIVKRANIQADPFIGEPDIRILEQHDIDYFSFVWAINAPAVNSRIEIDTIFVPINKDARRDFYLISIGHQLLSLVADVIVSKKSPVLSRLNRLIYHGFASNTDLKDKCDMLFSELLLAYRTVDTAWDVVNGEFTCNHGMLNYNRIYKGEYAYGAEELYDLIKS